MMKPDIENGGTDENPAESSRKWKLLAIVSTMITFTMIKNALTFFVLCGLSAGIGFATFSTQRQSQLIVFQNAVDSSVLQLQFTVQAALSQKFAASRLVGKLFGHATKLGYGTTYGQELPTFTLPGYQDITTEILTLAGNLRGT